jgi:25S rRNA (uracil2843-N3)-methyltransferase
MSSKFSVYDILEEHNFPTLFKDINQVHLITAFFLLNEILAMSKSSFVKLISQLVNNMTVGAYLLVVDSAGSFSELNISGKKYICYQLLDHMKVFECEFKSDAQWFRFPSGLNYPLKLNNMRYFCRLYKRV